MPCRVDYCKKQKCSVCPIKKYCNKNIASLIKGYDIDALVMVDLFCGAGGLSLGFTQEGFITSLANTTQFFIWNF